MPRSISRPRSSASKLTSKVSNLTPGFRLSSTNWHEGRDALSTVRRTVFIEEQRVPETLEWDAWDEPSLHVLALDATGAPIGCARLLPTGKIGRMAVLAQWRGKGVGRSMLQMLLQAARQQGLSRIELSAQVGAIPFYQKSGFRECSGTYMDAGIPHRDMVLTLSG